MAISHIYLGDCSRLKNLYKKASRNEPLSLVFLGASVTMAYMIEPQHQFLTAVKQYFENTYHATDITVHNMGTPGMTSLHGLYRSYTELEEKKPDLVVIDYAVNDQKSAPYRDCYESLLARCLSLPSEPAVFSFFVQTQDGYTCAPQMAAANQHYGVPYVNIGSWIMEDIQNGLFRWENYSYDDRHPGPFGHTWIGRRMVDFLKIVADAPEQHIPFPTNSFYDRSLANLDFESIQWENNPGTPATPLVLHKQCKVFFLIYDVGISSEYGNIQIEVDGEDIHIIDSYRVHEWDHVHEDLLYLSRKSKEHEICIRMQPGNENKYFHIHGFGFA